MSEFKGAATTLAVMKPPSSRSSTSPPLFGQGFLLRAVLPREIQRRVAGHVAETDILCPGSPATLPRRVGRGRHARATVSS